MSKCACGTVRLIGDVHGDAAALAMLYAGHQNAIQIGDLGMGFGGDSKLLHVLAHKGGPRFFRGNHDHPARCRTHPKHLESGLQEEGFFVVGGGFSIDWQHRVEGRSWWRDEEHSARELRGLIEQFADTKPRLVLSHEGPPRATDAMFNPRWKFESATAQALQAMWEAWQPDLWVFGHWHRDREVMDGKTLFVCLGEKKAWDVHLPSCALFTESATSTTTRLGAHTNRMRAKP